MMTTWQVLRWNFSLGEILILSVLAIFLGGCGGSWTSFDTTQAQNAVRDDVFIQNDCASDDGGCTPSEVRALSRGSYCSNCNMLFKHGESCTDAGISCPQQ